MASPAGQRSYLVLYAFSISFAKSVALLSMWPAEETGRSVSGALQA